MADLANDVESIRSEVARLAGWYHNIDLGHGVLTNPGHPDGNYPQNRFDVLLPHLPDIAGKTVLDVGCASGFFSIEMKRRGAARVVGIDYEAKHIEQSRFAAATLGVDVEFRQLDCYDVASLAEQFDVVVFLGVLYHLRHPLLALDLVRSVCREAMLFQTVLWDGSRPIDIPGDFGPASASELFTNDAFPASYFIEDRFHGDPTNWWIINRNGVTAMLRAAGFRTASETDAPDTFVVFVGDGPSSALPLGDFPERSRHRAPRRTPTRRLAARVRRGLTRGRAEGSGPYTAPAGVRAGRRER